MGSTERYADGPRGAAAKGPWVLHQAWPDARVVPIPVGEPLGRAYLERFGTRDPLVSESHCRLRATDNGIDVADPGSTNGTWIDGVRVHESALLREGGLLRIGGCVFVLRHSALRETEAPVDGGSAGELVAPFGFADLRLRITALAALPPTNVLVLGETGTGKEALAHAVAQRLGRDIPFETVNASAYRSDAFDAAFFGWERGAFTGAQASHAGVVGAAERGTLFLDELGDMPPSFQPLLLRFLENREVRRVGAAHAHRADVLVVAATHHDLESAVEEGRFREDLLARFAAPHLRLPPLRERSEDIPSIARALAARDGWVLDPEIDVHGVEVLMLEPLPRNVRGLRYLLQEARTAGSLRGGKSGIGVRPPSGTAGRALREPEATKASAPRLPDAETIRAAVSSHGSERRAAEVLGISRRQVRKALGADPRSGSRSGSPRSGPIDRAIPPRGGRNKPGT